MSPSKKKALNIDDEIFALMEGLDIPKNHLQLARSNLNIMNKDLRDLLMHKRLPDSPTSDLQIEQILLNFASLDSNNHSKGCGVGEREGRVYSNLVQRRHFAMSHGIGRSGDIGEPQPKAAGSSVMYKLTKHLVLDAIRRGSGIFPEVSGSSGKRNGASHDGILLPLCTGMSITMTLQALKSRVKCDHKNIVLWSRIDQKSCFKAILAAGLIPVVIPTKTNGDEVVTDLTAMQEELEGRLENVLAIITTTSAFAPRVPDSVDSVAKLCDEFSVFHVINNAYGLQCQKTCKLINRACAVGRVDAIVMSTDKNFMVPVGGAIVLSPKTSIIKDIGKVYPGRANASPILDLFITLLSMGISGYQTLLKKRQMLVEYFQEKMLEVADKYGERLLDTKGNTISYGMTLEKLADGESSSKQISYFGSMLFTRSISGTRVVPRGQKKTIAGEDFVGFGSSTASYHVSYLTAACAIGVTEQEIDDFIHRLDKALKDFHAKKAKNHSKEACNSVD